MANAFYPEGKSAFMRSEINMLTDTVSVVLIDSTDYTYSETHEFLSDVPAAARIASAALANKSVLAGVFDADNVTLSAVTGDEAEAVIIYQDTGVETTSRLIAYLDTGSGLPVTPNGDDININWSDSATKIFKL